MDNLARDFVSGEPRQYRFKFGHLIASSLTGLIGGIVAASIVWIVALKYFGI